MNKANGKDSVEALIYLKKIQRNVKDQLANERDPKKQQELRAKDLILQKRIENMRSMAENLVARKRQKATAEII